MPTERHSLLSDERTAAIVTPDARMVWLCAPRIGKAAEHQAQTDVFGPIMELVWRLGRAGAPLDERHWRLVELLVAAVDRRWREPGQGVWEIRAAPRHHVHSKTMCCPRLVRRHASRWPGQSGRCPRSSTPSRASLGATSRRRTAVSA